MIERIYGFAGRIFQLVRPVRDPHYLRFIRQFPCIGCKTSRLQRDAMHVGPHGLGQKASDQDALPGCRPCHKQLHAIGPMKFQSRRKVDFHELQIMFRAFYLIEFPIPEPPTESVEPPTETKEAA
jgi:hypothetical protein